MQHFGAFKAICSTLSVVLLAAVCVHGAGRVTVIRDGSLIFAAPDNSAAVLDILSRGTILEVLEEGVEWHIVRTSDGGSEGYIRSESVSETSVPDSFRPDSVRVGSLQYLQLQRSLDEAQDKMRQIAGTLERLNTKLDRAEAAEMAAAVEPAGSRPGAGAEAGGMSGGEEDRNICISAFYGAMIDDTDFTAGLSAAWFPGLPAGLGVELEAGAIFPEGVGDIYWGQLGVRYPLGNWGRITPYAAAGGGVIRRKYSSGTTVDIVETNPLVTAGAGLMVKLAGPAAVLTDFRYVWEFAAGGTQQDGRVYIGAALLK